MHESSLNIPARMIPDVRTGLHSILGDAAQDISHVSEGNLRERCPELYREPLVRFDRARGLLDIVGWGYPAWPRDVLVDAREHGWALVKALEVPLMVAEDTVREADLIDRERNANSMPSNEFEALVRVWRLREFLATVVEEVQILGGGGEPS